VVVLIIVKDLVEVISHYFASGIILKYLKKSIIIVLCKEGGEGKLNSYKLIAFKNMLIKVLKKHIVNIMFKVAEEHRLLF